MKDSKTANLNLQRTILNGAKIPHSVSQPVLRQEDGKWYLASFVFFYNREDIQIGMVNRPTVWALADLETGQLIREMQTKEREFSEASYDEKYSVRSDAEYDTSREYYDAAFAVLDTVREELLKTGNLNEEAYRNYMEKILANIPKAYQRFYRELSV